MQIEGYEIRGSAGKDPVSATYRAVQDGMDREVLIKVFPDADDRLLNEARTASVLNHPGIPVIYDVGRIARGVYICSQYAPGANLLAAIRKSGPLGAERTLDIAKQAAAALGHAHAEGVTHGFVWPGGISLGSDGRVRVYDFGASSAYSGLTGRVFSAYRSPDVAGETGDVYSLGAVLHHCLTGEPPPEDGLLENRMQGPLWPIIRRMLAPAGERFSGMDAVAKELQSVRPGQSRPSTEEKRGGSPSGASPEFDVLALAKKYRSTLTAAGAIVGLLIAYSFAKPFVQKALQVSTRAPRPAVTSNDYGPSEFDRGIGDLRDRGVQSAHFAGDPEPDLPREPAAEPDHWDPVGRLEQELPYYNEEPLDDAEEREFAADPAPEAAKDEDLAELRKKLLEPSEEVAAAVKAIIVEGAKAAEGAEVFYPMGASAARGTLVSADAAGITVKDRGQNLTMPWTLWDFRRQAALASKLAATGEQRYILALYLAQNKLFDESSRELDEAIRADVEVAERADFLRSAYPKPEIVVYKPQTRTPKEPGEAKPAEGQLYHPAKGRTPPRGLRTDRPRLLMTRERAEFFRRQGSTLTGYGTMRAVAADDPTALALIYLIEGTEAQGRAAVDAAMKVVRGGRDSDLNSCHPHMASVAKVYDWCYPLIEPKERQAMADWMVSQFDSLKDSYRGFPYHNYHIRAGWAFTLAGYALYGDHPRAEEMIRNGARERLEAATLPVFTRGVIGGAWAEGEGYGHTTGGSLVEWMEAVRTCEGIDHFADPRARAFLQARISYYMLGIYPGSHGGREMLFFTRGDGQRWGNMVPARGQFQALIYAYAGSSVSNRALDFLAKHYPNPPERAAAHNDVFWALRPVDRLPHEEFRLSHHAAGQGIVLMKSDWSPDATFVNFTCGDRYSYHSHADSGSFNIARFGQDLASYAGEYWDGGDGSHAHNFYVRTIAKNSIVLSGFEGATVNLHRAGPADDGGALYNRRESFEELGNILAYDSQPGYVYVVGDPSAGYQGRLRGWTRHVLFVRPETVIVFDVLSPQAGRIPRWLLHTWNEPSVSGPTFRAENGAAALPGVVLLPRNPRIEKIGGPGKEHWVGNRNYPLSKREGPTPAWRLEISPQTSEPTTAFLVVMQAVRSGSRAPMQVGLIADRGIGCTVGDSISVRFRQDGAPGGVLQIGANRFNLGTFVSQDED